MAASALTCQAIAGFNLGARKAPKPTYPAPTGVPLHQQVSWTRPQTTTYAASSSTLDPRESWRPNGTNFVRPDLMDAAEEISTPSYTRSSQASFPSPAHFRSALEQVSFETNNSLWERDTASASKTSSGLRGLLGKAARAFGN